MQLPARASLAKGGLLVLGAVGFALLAFPYVNPSSDSYHALAWGDLLAAGETPDFDAGPVKHPLQITVAALFAPLGPEAAQDIFRFVSALAFAALLYAVYRLGRALWAPAIGLVGVAILLTRPDLIVHATSCSREIPLAAFVLLALALAIEDSDRNWPKALVLLGVAGLLRPEAWALSILYAAWLLARRPGKGSGVEARPGAIVITALAAPAIWMLFDLALTGDALDTYRSVAGDEHGPPARGADAEPAEASRLPLDHYVSVLRAGIPGLIGWPLTLLGSAVGGYALWLNRDRLRAPGRGDPLLAVVAMVLALLAMFIGLAVLDVVTAPRFLLLPAIGLVTIASALLVLPRVPAVTLALLATGVAIAVALPGDLSETVDTLDLQKGRNGRDADLAALASRPEVREALEGCSGLFFVSDAMSFTNRGRAIVAPRLEIDAGEIEPRRRVDLGPDEAAFAVRVRPPSGARFRDSAGIWTVVSRCAASGARSGS